ncbi:hypothetical protein D1092_05700 [Bartonella krasnovii]|uniref:Uncharacterized protein n=1 Tax=Bartonella krasnovii TaxID=2267275 RepID=A0A5B9D1Z9_9HYPH|nr:hypothetical protein D1092_05700 [Bartonella krasnovii]
MQYSCYGIKCFKQQEILIILYAKKQKRIINCLKMVKFRQKKFKMHQFEAILFSKVLIRIYNHHNFYNNFFHNSGTHY